MKSKILKWAGVLLLFLIITILLSNYWIISSTKEKLYQSITDIPENKVGLVLGANKQSRLGGRNLFFFYRIQAAAELYKAGKIKHIIVSGDNHIKEYDEATDMQQALMGLGIPDTVITLDFAGLRTFDSVVRCKEIFGQNSFTIISQEFHNQRAVFIANKRNITAIAYNAKDVPAKYSFKTMMREYVSKFKAVLDLYILHTEPRFLGDKVEIK